MVLLYPLEVIYMLHFNLEQLQSQSFISFFTLFLANIFPSILISFFLNNLKSLGYKLFVFLWITLSVAYFQTNFQGFLNP